MKRWFVFSIIFLFMSGWCQSANAAGTELMNTFSIRITVIEDAIEYEWEYDSPNQYEFEYGERVIKGDKAKKKVEEMVHILKLNEQADVDDLVKRVQDSLHPNVERLDIRYMNGEGKLYTWVWEDKN